MRLFYAFGGLGRLRKHGRNRRTLAGKSSFFCDTSVILQVGSCLSCDTAGVNDLGLRYFEDYTPGTTYECGSVRIDEASIINFAQQYDPQPFHTDPVAAATGPFGGLVASGWHTAGLVMRLLVDNYLSAEASLGAPGLDELRWPRPVRPGDTLAVRATVVEARKSQSKPDRGIVKTLVEAVNQDGKTVMSCIPTNFLLVRPPDVTLG
jgi:acyl dehydratase